MLPQGKKPGGAPANFAIHAQSLGANAKIVSAVGNDESGNKILELLSEKSVDTEYIQVLDHKTSSVDVVLDDNGHPDYVIHENVAWEHIELTEDIALLAKKCDAVYFGSLAQRNITSHETIQRFLQNTKKDALRVFDINLRQGYYSRKIIEKSLAHANIFKLNDDELEFLQSFLKLPAPAETALKELLERYELDLVALTKGSKGSTMLSRDNIHYSDGIPVKIKDTVGAGDSFTATMVMGLLCSLPLDKINHLAGKVAAFVCSQDGATPALPAELISEIKEHVRQNSRKLFKHHQSFDKDGLCRTKN